MLKGDILGIINSFSIDLKNSCRSLLYDTYLLSFYFAQICIRHTWKKINMCADYAINEGVMLDNKVV